jgi:threonine dehydrogenase-like Zn-dependent dehydrogenase
LLDDWRGELASLIVEATGTVEGFQRAVEATSPRGTLVLKSTVSESARMNLAPLVIDEITVVGSRCGPFPPALRALETGAIDVRSLITDRFPLSRAPEALDRAHHPTALKVLLDPLL